MFTDGGRAAIVRCLSYGIPGHRFWLIINRSLLRCVSICHCRESH